MTNTSNKVKSRTGAITTVIIVVLIFILKPLLVLGYNVFLFLHKLFYSGTAVSFEVWWTITGLLVGAVFGAWIARRKYNLATKWVWYPAGGLAFFVLIFFMINKV